MPDNSTEEFLDVLADDGSILGTASRREVHQKGLWHRTFHALVVRPDLPARVVFQRRAASSSFAGLLDFTASGHLAAGELPVDGVRELEEEVGLRVTAGDLVPLGVHRIIDHRNGITNREQVHVFFVASDVALDRFRPDPSEVSGLVEIEVEPLLTLVDPDHPADRIEAVEWEPGTAPTGVTIGHDDLMPGYDAYLIKTLVMAERFAAGKSPIAI